MKYTSFFCIASLSWFLLFGVKAHAKVTSIDTCQTSPRWFKSSCLRLHQIWTQGSNELYLPTYAWHNRYTYEPSKIGRYNEFPLGAGLGKSFYDENGNWHGLYAMAFLDSHKNVEPTAGYAFLKTAHFKEKGIIGLGATVLVTSRPDIMNSVPIAGVLPWFGIGYGPVTLSGAYIPGSKNIGNVLFLITRIVM